MATILETTSYLVIGSPSFACLWYWTGLGSPATVARFQVSILFKFCTVMKRGRHGDLWLLNCVSPSKYQGSTCVVGPASLLPGLLRTKP